jgi:ATP-dependent DNA helicase RecG
MDWTQVKALLQNGPSADTAFAPEQTAAPLLAEMLSALANASGGTLLLGVTRAGSMRGVRNVQDSVERVLEAALNIVPPLVLPMPDQVESEGRTLIAVQVPHGLPHVYSSGERYLVREGAENRELKPSEIHHLMMQRGSIRFETQVPADAVRQDLDWDRVRQYANRLSQLSPADPEHVLLRRACLGERDGALAPTYAGLLLFGHEPMRWSPGAQITAVRYPGTEMGDKFVREDISGPLPDQIRKAEAFLRANSAQQVVLEGLTREERPAYPGDVLREVIVNAVAHRDYTIQGENIRVLVYGDRIQVYSPGKLPGHITVENMVRERFSRNPVIVQVLADMGFIERLGYGIDRMLHLLQEAKQPAPRFEETTAGFQVTLWAHPARAAIKPARWARLDLNARQELAVQYTIQHQRITNREYQKLCSDVSAETIRRDLSDLVHKDILLRIGRKRATYYILKDASIAGG